MVATAGRWLVYVMILFTVGSLAYLVLVHRGTRREGRRIVFLIRRSAILVIVGSAMEWFAQLAVYGSGSITDVVSPSAWGDLLSTSFALGTACRIMGAALVLRFVPIEVVAEDPIDFADLDVYDLFGELASPGSAATAVVSEPETRLARVRVESGPLAFVGALLLVVSESFIRPHRIGRASRSCTCERCRAHVGGSCLGCWRVASRLDILATHATRRAA